MMKYSKSQKGFTLIELLIVIAIIGILAAVILIALAGARQRARDAARKSDVDSIQNAVELYASDTGKYPAGLVDVATTEYFAGGTLPTDPLFGTEYNYDADDDGSIYCVWAELERDIELVVDGVTETGPWFANGPGCLGDPTDYTGFSL
ncbi:type II secretion system protein [Patescibacteria group bacterium]